MIVGIAGLGLIGGSMAKAYKRDESIKVLGYDIDPLILNFARLTEAVDDELTDENISSCDLLLLAAYPDASREYLISMAPYIDSHTYVIDCLGTKRVICREGFDLAEQYGFTFAGGHPMAGTQYSGFKYAREDLFDGQSMVIVPPRTDDILLLDTIKKLLAPAGFGNFSFTSAEDHDEVIAYTSQLAHVVSNAYVKSPTARKHQGFSAGSYKDLTRVAWLNPQMWSELFLENGDYLTKELEILIRHLQEYQKAIEEQDQEQLIKLLDEGRRLKKEIDGTV